MPKPDKFGLFCLRENPYFPEGTLFDLRDASPLLLPDRGDGRSVEIERPMVIACPPFAENVPPGRCPVQITSFILPDGADLGEIASVVVEHTIHYQKIAFPITAVSVLSVSVFDRVREFEADHYEAAAVKEDGFYRLHIGNLPPGSYKAEMILPETESATITFIKMFPPPFANIYSALVAKENSETAKASSKTADKELGVSIPHGFESKFSSRLLNLALELTTEWGENFGKPINDRILAKYPDLTGDEITELTKLARQAESFIYSLAERELAGEIGEVDIPALAAKEFPWLDRNNASRLTGIGMYYSRR